MTTHDIELPPEFRSGNSVPVTVATIKRERMEEIIRAAIEADRKRRGEPVTHQGYQPIQSGPLPPPPRRPAEPVKVPSDADILDLWTGDPTHSRPVMGKNKVIAFARALLARYGQHAQPAEPVKVPSEAEEALWKAYESLRELEKQIVLDVNQISGAAAANFAANRVLALLARYGQEQK